ncbi:MAG: EutN/CcmL family microcompartment protein [Acidobacteria bacterium]|nr:EutN/CcmL family microcompartment protein [Acidobacteriota bacterium]
MILARVVGNVVATQKHPAYHGFKMMIVQPIHPTGAHAGAEFLAADAVGSGEGERVLVVAEGKSAGDAVRVPGAPLDAAIVAIVDILDVDDAPDTA